MAPNSKEKKWNCDRNCRVLEIMGDPKMKKIYLSDSIKNSRLFDGIELRMDSVDFQVDILNEYFHIGDHTQFN